MDFNIADLISTIILPNEDQLQTCKDMILPYTYDKDELWNRGSWGHYAYLSRMLPVLQFITKHMPRGSTILDIGCAQGNFSLFLGQLGYKATGVDIREFMIEYARMKLQSGTERQRLNVTFENMDIRMMSSKAKFDVVLFLEIVEHLANPKDAVENALSLLKHEGIFVMSTPNGGRFHLSPLPSYEKLKLDLGRTQFDSSARGDQHVFEFRKHELISFLHEVGLSVVEIVPCASLLFYPIRSLLPASVITQLNRLFSSSLTSTGYVVFCKKSKAKLNLVNQLQDLPSL